MTNLAGSAEPGPGAVTVDIGRASVIAVVMGVVLFGALAAGGVYAALDTEETTVRVIGFCVAGLLAVLPIMFLHRSLEDAVKDYVADKVKDALKLDGRRRIAVEIFPAGPDVMVAQPMLARYRREQRAPSPELHPVRWRLPLPPVVGVARGVEHGVLTFQPHRRER